MSCGGLFRVADHTVNLQLHENIVPSVAVAVYKD